MWLASRRRTLRTRCAPLVEVNSFTPLASRPASVLRTVFSHESEQALVVLRAGGTALEMGGHPGNYRVRVASVHLELDVAVEQLEAPLAAHLGLGGAQEAPDHFIGPIGGHIVTSVSLSAARSLRRASWITL